MFYHKCFLNLVKYVPALQMLGTLARTILSCYDMKFPMFVIDYCLGTTLSDFIMLMIASYIFKFCALHKALIIANLINDGILTSTEYIYIGETEINLFIIQQIISAVILTAFIYTSIINRETYERQIKTIKRYIGISDRENRQWYLQPFRC